MANKYAIVNVVIVIVKYVIVNRDSEACLWGRSVQFQTYISELLQMNGIWEILSAGMSVNTNSSLSQKLGQKFKLLV